jgi:hypothetical protein
VTVDPSEREHEAATVSDAVTSALDAVFGEQATDLIEEMQPTPPPDLAAGEEEIARTSPNRYG